MFKKIILLIAFAAFAAIMFFATVNVRSNDRRVSAGGWFTRDHYINSSVGIDVDLSDRWVYFDLDSVSKSALSELGAVGATSDIADLLIFAVRPGITVGILDMGEQLGKDIMSIEQMYYLQQESIETLRGGGTDCKALDHGRLAAASDIYFYSLGATYNGDPVEILYSFVNTPRTGLLIVAIAQNGADMNTAKDLIIDEIKINDDAAGESA